MRFSNFMKHSGADITAKYVSLHCADNYWTSIDMPTALHAQTLLALTGTGRQRGARSRRSAAQMVWARRIDRDRMRWHLRASGGGFARRRGGHYHLVAGAAVSAALPARAAGRVAHHRAIQRRGDRRRGAKPPRLGTGSDPARQSGVGQPRRKVSGGGCAYFAIDLLDPRPSGHLQHPDDGLVPGFVCTACSLFSRHCVNPKADSTLERNCRSATR